MTRLEPARLAPDPAGPSHAEPTYAETAVAESTTAEPTDISSPRRPPPTYSTARRETPPPQYTPRQLEAGTSQREYVTTDQLDPCVSLIADHRFRSRQRRAPAERRSREHRGGYSGNPRLVYCCVQFREQRSYSRARYGVPGTVGAVCVATMLIWYAVTHM